MIVLGLESAMVKRLRPATGRDPVVAERLPDQALAKVEKWAADNNCSRSEAIRAMIDSAPAAPKPGRGK